MTTRRTFLASGAAAAAILATGAWRARADNAPGITDTEIKIGQTMPYSGPASAYGVIGKTEAAYFKMINEQGGINGRKINLISLDDAYSPPKTVEQTRRLVEQEQVAFIFNSLGTAPQRCDPAISQRQQGAATVRRHRRRDFLRSRALSLDDRLSARTTRPRRAFSPSTSWRPSPTPKSRVLYQNDGFGKDYLIGLKAGLGADHAGMVIKEASYETSEPTVDSQVVTLQGSGADVFLIAATPKFAAQAIRKSRRLGWTARYITDVSLRSPPC